MKNILLITIIILGTFFFSSCESELYQSVSLNIGLEAKDGYMDNDTLVVKMENPVTFRLLGNPDLITFYSGELGKEYSKKDLTEFPAGDIESVLKFSAYSRYGAIAGTMRVFISSTFQGLLLNNKYQDSLNIETHNWIEITDKCNLPTTNGGIGNASISLTEYVGKPLTIAFLYETARNEEAQPTWEIRNLQTVNTLKDNGNQTIIQAAKMSFVPLDMLGVGSAAYISSENIAGKWYLGNIANASSPQMRIQVSPVGDPLNKDWLVSKPIILNSRNPDRGIAIKNITERKDSYEYRYNSTGLYEATFVGYKSNYEHSEEHVRKAYIRVIE